MPDNPNFTEPDARLDSEQAAVGAVVTAIVTKKHSYLTAVGEKLKEALTKKLVAPLSEIVKPFLQPFTSLGDAIGSLLWSAILALGIKTIADVVLTPISFGILPYILAPVIIFLVCIEPTWHLLRGMYSLLKGLDQAFKQNDSAASKDFADATVEFALIIPSLAKSALTMVLPIIMGALSIVIRGGATIVNIVHRLSKSSKVQEGGVSAVPTPGAQELDPVPENTDSAPSNYQAQAPVGSSASLFSPSLVRPVTEERPDEVNSPFSLQ